MFDELSNKKFRDAFLEANIKTGIAFQVRALREHHGWSQAELGRRAGKPQNVISRLEDPDYGKFTIRTLLDLASAFDVALLVKFVSYSYLASSLEDVSPTGLAVPSFEEEMKAFEADVNRTGEAISAAQPSEDANRKPREPLRGSLVNIQLQRAASDVLKARPHPYILGALLQAGQQRKQLGL